MNARRTALALLAPLLLAAACQQEGEAHTPTPSPGDGPVATACSGTFSYGNGSMEAPFSYSWKLEFDETSASFSLTSPYAGEPPVWELESTYEEGATAALCEAVAETPPDETPATGGPVASWDVDSGSGSTTVRDEIPPLTDLAIDLIGREQFDEVKAEYDQWSEEQSP